jgi:hypothetical protein
MDQPQTWSWRETGRCTLIVPSKEITMKTPVQSNAELIGAYVDAVIASRM